MNLILLYLPFDPRFWWLTVGVAASAQEAETDEGAQT